jgi:hypothetical protein
LLPPPLPPCFLCLQRFGDGLGWFGVWCAWRWGCLWWSCLRKKQPIVKVKEECRIYHTWRIFSSMARAGEGDDMASRLPPLQQLPKIQKFERQGFFPRVHMSSECRRRLTSHGEPFLGCCVREMNRQQQHHHGMIPNSRDWTPAVRKFGHEV